MPTHDVTSSPPTPFFLFLFTGARGRSEAQARVVASRRDGRRASRREARDAEPVEVLQVDEPSVWREASVGVEPGRACLGQVESVIMKTITRPTTA